MSDRRKTLRVLAIALSAALALGGAVSGCGQKGALVLPHQKKSRVPATPSNPAPDTPDTSGDTPSDTSPPTSASTPTPTA
jgi:predicted small lipoprotein YifL